MKPTNGSAALELFLSRLEYEIFELLPGKSKDYNLSKEQCLTMKALASDRSIVIKAADKGSWVVVWDRGGYIAEAKRQVNDNAIYRSFEPDENHISELVKQSNTMFEKLANNKVISDKELKYFTYTQKKG